MKKERVYLFAVFLIVAFFAGFLRLSHNEIPSKMKPEHATKDEQKDDPVIPERKSITIAAVGDVMFDRRVKEAVLTNGAKWPFEKTASSLNADISIANLESSLASKGSPVEGKDVVFQGTPLGIKSLKSAGINLVSLANNHAFDYGLQSLIETRKNLLDSKIAFSGAGENKYQAYEPAIISIGDLKVGFLSFSDVIPFNSFPSEKYPGIAPARDPKKVAQKIRALSKKVHIVIVAFHWGVEYEDYPNGKQKELATTAIDAGADLILGHHPHVIQGVALYKKKLIFYSLGNFVFDRFKTKTAQSLILRVNMDHRGQFGEARIYPVMISTNGQPSVATGSEGEAILSRIKTVSGNYGSLLNKDGQTFVIKTGN